MALIDIGVRPFSIARTDAAETQFTYTVACGSQRTQARVWDRRPEQFAVGGIGGGRFEKSAGAGD